MNAYLLNSYSDRFLPREVEKATQERADTMYVTGMQGEPLFNLENPRS